MNTAEEYIVLVAAVRLLKDGSCNLEKVEKILSLPVFKEESFEYTKLYSNLIQAMVDKKALEFINNFLDDIESESVYCDHDIVVKFRTLKDYCDEIYFMTHKIEEQLMSHVYTNMEDSYENHKEKVIEYLCENQVLYGIKVFKEKGKVINKSMFFLDVVTAMSEEDIEKMERLSFHF